MGLSERQTSRDFRGAEKDFVGEKWCRKKDGTTPDMRSRVQGIVCSLSATQDKDERETSRQFHRLVRR